MRPSSDSNNRNPKRFQDFGFDLLPEAGDFRKFNNALMLELFGFGGRSIRRFFKIIELLLVSSSINL